MLMTSLGQRQGTLPLLFQTPRFHRVYPPGFKSCTEVRRLAAVPDPIPEKGKPSFQALASWTSRNSVPDPFPCLLRKAIAGSIGLSSCWPWVFFGQASSLGNSLPSRPGTENAEQEGNVAKPEHGLDDSRTWEGEGRCFGFFSLNPNWTVARARAGNPNKLIDSTLGPALGSTDLPPPLRLM